MPRLFYLLIVFCFVLCFHFLNLSTIQKWNGLFFTAAAAAAVFVVNESILWYLSPMRNLNAKLRRYFRLVSYFCSDQICAVLLTPPTTSRNSIAAQSAHS